MPAARYIWRIAIAAALDAGAARAQPSLDDLLRQIEDGKQEPIIHLYGFADAGVQKNFDTPPLLSEILHRRAARPGARTERRACSSPTCRTSSARR